MELLAKADLAPGDFKDILNVFSYREIYIAVALNEVTDYTGELHPLVFELPGSYLLVFPRMYL